MRTASWRFDSSGQYGHLRRWLRLWEANLFNASMLITWPQLNRIGGLFSVPCVLRIGQANDEWTRSGIGTSHGNSSIRKDISELELLRVKFLNVRTNGIAFAPTLILKNSKVILRCNWKYIVCLLDDNFAIGEHSLMSFYDRKKNRSYPTKIAFEPFPEKGSKKQRFCS